MFMPKIISLLKEKSKFMSNTIKIYEVSGNSFEGEKGIHVVNPLKTEIDQAIIDAINNNHRTIWVHRSLSLKKNKTLITSIRVESRSDI
jgi:hypothetical protein